MIPLTALAQGKSSQVDFDVELNFRLFSGGEGGGREEVRKSVTRKDECWRWKRVGGEESFKGAGDGEVLKVSGRGFRVRLR